MKIHGTDETDWQDSSFLSEVFSFFIIAYFLLEVLFFSFFVV